MKKIIFLILTVLLFVHCTHAGNNKNAATQNGQESESVVKHINRSEFLTKVFNYEKDVKTFRFLGSKPVIVDFYATWCGPCKQLSPILEELAKEYKGAIQVYKIDTDQEKQLAQDLGIQALPTLIFFPKKGKPVAIQGFRPKEELKKIIDTQLLK